MGEHGSRHFGLALGIALALSVSGCSFALPSLVPAKEDVTGSIAPKRVAPLIAGLDGEDWRRAKATLAIALDPQGSGTSVGWSNPDSGNKGSFVPVGKPFVRSDDICRAFVATIDRQGGSDTTMQGTACRISADEWDITDISPWKKPG
jgi:surface antigen